MLKNAINGLTRIPIYIIVFLLPLLALPFTVESYEFSKLYLLFGLVLIGLIGWFGRIIFVERSLVFKRTPLDIGILVLLVSTAIVSFFSRDIVSSLLGFYGRFSGGVIELVLWILFFLIITNNFTYLTARRLFLALFASSFVLSLWFQLTFWGLLGSISFLSFITITPLGISPQALAVFEAVSLVLLFLYWSLCEKEKGIRSLLFAVAAVASLSVLVMINFYGAWWILLLSSVPFLAWTLKAKVLNGPEINRLTLVVLIILVSLVFIVFSRQVSIFAVPVEIQLNHTSSFAVASQMLRSFPESIVGVGPANFSSAYLLFRPVEFNQSNVWAARFDTASSHYLNVLVTGGVVGALGFLFFVGLAFYLSLRMLRAQTEVKRESAFYVFGLISILISMGFYYQALSFSLLLWLLLAPLGLLLLHARSKEEYRYDFGFSPEANLFLTSLFFVGVFAFALVGYFGGRFYAGDVAYRKAFLATETTEQMNHLVNAVTLSPFRIEYKLALAQSSLRLINEKIQRAGADNIEDLTPLTNLAAQAVSLANESIALSGRSVGAWENRAAIYRELRSLEASGSATTFALESFITASELDPVNPSIPLQIARLHIDAGDIQKGEEFLDISSSLKPDYLNVQLVRALLLEQEDELEEAIALLDEVALSQGLGASLAQDVFFHLGRIAFNADQVEKAITALEKVVELNPEHANAHFALGIAYQQDGQGDKAREQYEKVLELNPDAVQVRERLEAL